MTDETKAVEQVEDVAPLGWHPEQISALETVLSERVTRFVRFHNDHAVRVRCAERGKMHTQRVAIEVLDENGRRSAFPSLDRLQAGAFGLAISIDEDTNVAMLTALHEVEAPADAGADAAPARGRAKRG